MNDSGQFTDKSMQSIKQKSMVTLSLVSLVSLVSLAVMLVVFGFS